ncbi:hypothetical protein DFP72DRAFT_851364 [Ephemerocybe angulata]|uniref:Protein kinase domain-containing protein n=1 Tax=Ephemerocybe angulata TaxID=980116 RepID=A0A8H6HR66_9AGAR|nr:hypothetical protein DFP72DRAFT_851364 [Tulosesus angulatus]
MFTPMVHNSRKISAEGRVKAGFGKWDLDVHKKDIWPKCTIIQVTSTKSVSIYKDAYLVKIIETHSELGEATYAYRAAALPKEITIMLLAGNNCTFPPIGRVHLASQSHYLQEVPQDRPLPEHPEIQSAQTQILALTELVARLHAKGIIHRDIKPANLITTQDAFHLLFCDFRSANIGGNSMGHISDTVQY